MSFLAPLALRHALPALLLVLAACGTPDQAATPVAYADDAGVTARVRIALVQHPIWRDANLQVTTQSGVVLVTGSVPQGQTEASLATLIREVEGVQEVRLDTR